MIPRLKRLRVARGWSQEELARRAACDRIGILCYERGLRHAITPVALRIAEALELPFEEVWSEDTEPPVADLPRGRPRKPSESIKEVSHA